jgi:two-component system response regulator (stage 0 sporulation protein A)
MTEMIKVLLVDDNKELCSLIMEKIDGKNGVKVVGSAWDGVSAISMISKLEPDIVLLDLIMPNLDGLGVLEWAAGGNAQKRPAFIVFTAIGGDIVVQRAMELGADYYMVKPVDTEILLTRILQIYGERKGTGVYLTGISSIPGAAAASRLEQTITDLIKSMGVTPNLAGYIYLREAVLMAAEEPEKLNSVSRTIFSELARKHNTNTRNIDRAIRCAIDSAQKKTKDLENPIRDAYMALTNKRRPNNALIIRYLADMAIRKTRPFGA